MKLALKATLPLLLIACSSATETDGTSTDALMQCAVPPKYDFVAYTHTHNSKGVEFTFDAAPELGVMTHEVFIPAHKVKIGPFAYFLGDNRPGGPDPNFDPKKTRAFIVLDFAHGKGWIAVNASHAQLCAFTCLTFTGSPFGVKNDYYHGENRIWADWLDHDTFRVHVSLHVATPDMLAFLKQKVADIGCSIDHQILINTATGQVRFEGDAFPSTGTYWYDPLRADCHPIVLNTTNATHPSALCGERKFTHNFPATTHRPPPTHPADAGGPETCSTDSECDGGKCVNGVCSDGGAGTACSTNADCDGGLCENGVCTDAGGGRACSTNADCDGGLCENGVCTDAGASTAASEPAATSSDVVQLDMSGQGSDDQL